MFHDDVKQGSGVEAATPGFVDSHQVRMRKLRGGTPARKLAVSFGAVGGNQFDGGLGRRLSRSFGKKDRAVVRPAQPLAKRKFSVDDTTLPRFPEPRITHSG